MSLYCLKNIVTITIIIDFHVLSVLILYVEMRGCTLLRCWRGGTAHRGLHCKVRELLMKENYHGK